MTETVVSESGHPPAPHSRGPGGLRLVVWTGVAVLLLGTGWLALQVRERRSEEVILRSALVRALLAGPAPEWIPGDRAYRRRVWDDVRRVYARRDERTLWIQDHAPSRAAYAFTIALTRAPQDGLDADAYGEPAIKLELTNRRDGPPASAEEDAGLLARFDVRVTTAFVRFVRERHEGRLPASVLDRDWSALRDTVDMERALARGARGDINGVLSEFDRRDEDYRRLREMVRTYRTIVSRGGWPEFPPGKPPRTVDEDERWVTLRRRLAISGDLADSSGGAAYDAGLARGIRRFQLRHGLAGTGKLGDATVAALNVTAAERLRSLELNLERMRWLPERLPDPIIRVNIPDSHLRLLDHGVEPLAMKAVVGSPSDPTPVFSDIMTYVEFHPTWSIPTGILVREMLPQFKRNRDYFRENQMRVIGIDGKEPLEVDPSDVPWERVEEDSFPYIVRQDAGPENPLGQVKFMCPNEYDVYLHDTSARRTFGYVARFLSHGCVRVQDPMVLAGYLLQDTRVESPDSIDAIIRGNAWRRIGLKRRMPVLVEYRTSWVDDDGVLQFRPDVYGLDRRLDAALRSGRVSDFDINPDVSRNSHTPPTAEWAALEYQR